MSYIKCKHECASSPSLETFMNKKIYIFMIISSLGITLPSPFYLLRKLCIAIITSNTHLKNWRKKMYDVLIHICKLYFICTIIFNTVSRSCKKFLLRKLNFNAIRNILCTVPAKHVFIVQFKVNRHTNQICNKKYKLGTALMMLPKFVPNSTILRCRSGTKFKILMLNFYQK